MIEVECTLLFFIDFADKLWAGALTLSGLLRTRFFTVQFESVAVCTLLSIIPISVSWETSMLLWVIKSMMAIPILSCWCVTYRVAYWIIFCLCRFFHCVTPFEEIAFQLNVRRFINFIFIVDIISFYFQCNIEISVLQSR